MTTRSGLKVGEFVDLSMTQWSPAGQHMAAGVEMHSDSANTQTLLDHGAGSFRTPILTALRPLSRLVMTRPFQSPTVVRWLMSKWSTPQQFLTYRVYTLVVFQKLIDHHREKDSA